MNGRFDNVREVDQVVLQHIQEGCDDVHEVSQATGHGNKKVGYSFDKLEEIGLLNVERPDGMVERVVDGQKRKFRAPKQAELTDLGEQYLAQAESVDIERYGDINQSELIQRVIALEQQVDELEEKLELFRKQVQKRL